MPSDGVLDALKADYNAMRNMIYGEIPEFEEILNYLNALQEEVHKLTVNQKVTITCPLCNFGIMAWLEGEIDENGEPVKKSSK